MDDERMHPELDPDEEPLRVLIVFYSRTGTTRELAQEVANGARTISGATTTLREVEERPLLLAREGETDDDRRRRLAATINELTTADAVVVGAPAYFGSMASPLKRFFEECATGAGTILDRTRPWHHYLFRDKAGGAFTSSGTPHGGNEQALQSMLTMLMHLGVLIVTPGQRGPILEQPAAPYGATAIATPGRQSILSDAEREEARFLGRRVAETALWLREGRLVGSAYRRTADSIPTPEQSA